MGIIKAVAGAIGGGLADQWLEVYEPSDMQDTTVFVPGVKVHKDSRRTSNTKGTDNTVSNGSIIHVYDDQLMLLLDGGKVVDYTAEPGYYKVENSALPSMFNGQFKDTLKESFSRIKYGGITPTAQKVFYINTQEIKGIKFGTPNPVNYFDNFYNAELHLRAHGTYSIRITDPFKFYAEAIPRAAVTSNTSVDISQINSQYLAEFLEAFQAALNQLSADGERISFVTSKGTLLSRHMRTILDEEWNQARGFVVEAVGIASISYDEESQRLINLRNEGAMLSDQNIQAGYMAGKIGEGIASAGENQNGAMAGFLGMGMAMNAGGNIMGGYQQAQAQQQQQANAGAQPQWTCSCGAKNTGKFCSECGKPKTEENGWICACGAKNTGKFCSECGKPKPVQPVKCSKCGYEPKDGIPKFCPECGHPFE